MVISECERLKDQVVKLRSALVLLLDEATNRYNISTWDGWHIVNPYLNLPPDVLKQVRNALDDTKEKENVE